MKPYHFTIDRDGYGAAEFARGRYRWADAVLDYLDSETTDALGDGSLGEFRVDLGEAEATKYTPLRFVLKTSGPTSDGKPVRFGRRSLHRQKGDGSYSRVPGRVFWHGHREFFDHLFVIAPGAWVKSAKATYDGADGYAREVDNSRGVREYHGFRAFDEACDCDEPDERYS